MSYPSPLTHERTLPPAAVRLAVSHPRALTAAHARELERARGHARVALLDAMIRVLHQERAVAALDADPSEPPSARAVSAMTEQLLTEGLVSPGELMFMHQRAHVAATAD